MLRQAAPFFGGLFCGLLAAGLLFLLLSPPRGHPILLEPPPTPAPYRVHVTGEVIHPGVITLPPGSIIAEAIEAAGGPTGEAQLEALNLAAPLHDGERVIVPALAAETSVEMGSPISTAAPGAALIPLNTATAAELDLLPGIGPTLANAIVEYRQENGPFHAVDELLEVPGIGPAKLAMIRDLVDCR
jgi:competence protein ComEA